MILGEEQGNGAIVSSRMLGSSRSLVGSKKGGNNPTSNRNFDDNASRRGLRTPKLSS
jgi:hypothetical protein